MTGTKQGAVAVSAQHTPVAIGMRVARHVFNERGNHSEAHLTERELAVVITVGISQSAAPTLLEALRGPSDMPMSISPLGWLVDAIKELERRGPASDDPDPPAFWEMVSELKSLDQSARAAIALATGENHDSN